MPKCCIYVQYMIVLRYIHGGRRFEVADFSFNRNSEAVPVLLRGNSYKMVGWKGFVDLERVKTLANPRPVRLVISEYSVAVGSEPIWYKVPKGHWVQGALMEKGVYAVMYHGVPRMVGGNKSA